MPSVHPVCCTHVLQSADSEYDTLTHHVPKSGKVGYIYVNKLAKAEMWHMTVQNAC